MRLKDHKMLKEMAIVSRTDFYIVFVGNIIIIVKNETVLHEKQQHNSQINRSLNLIARKSHDYNNHTKSKP